MTIIYKLKTKGFSKEDGNCRVRLHHGKNKWNPRGFLCDQKTIKQYTYHKPVPTPGDQLSLEKFTQLKDRNVKIYLYVKIIA